MLHSDGGFTKFPNYLRDAPWRNDSNTAAVYFYLRINANHFKTGWNGVYLEPGELIASYASLKEATGLTIQKVRTAINRLKSTGDITTRSTNRFTIFSFTDKENWDFETGSATSRLTSSSTGNQQTANKRLTLERDRETKKQGNGETGRPPSLDEVTDFFRQNDATSEQGKRFFLYFDGLDWKIGKTPITKWESLALKWISEDSSKRDEEEYDPYAGLPVFGSWDR